MAEVTTEFTLKQRVFIEAYVGEARGNATKAATIAGYSDPRQSGYENKTNPDIWAAIESKLKERTLAADEVLEKLTEHANATLEPFLYQKGDVAVVDLSSDEAKANLHLLKKIKCKRRTGGREDDRWEVIETEIELHDPQSALVHIGRYHKLFTDKTEGAMTVEGAIGYRITPPHSDGSGDDTAESGD